MSNLRRILSDLCFIRAAQLPIFVKNISTMAKNRSILWLLIILSITTTANEKIYHQKVYVDNKGVMRDSGTHKEVSYYGVNYTVPFAHAYRALGYLGVDRKLAIERDVYHMWRLGFTAFRIHVWDVEISDAEGNLLQNDHLDLLDYLIAELKKRDIDIVLTAQTNFGNGYPERDIDTGAFTYDYEKCRIHDTEEAIKIQERYIYQFVTHLNPYTGKSYAADPAVIGIEINNEPCHSGDAAAATHYINRMVASAGKGDWKKPLFYNVSHNQRIVQGFLDADIQGGTYQWYPVGLVAGYERKGNFLPLVDNYDIPFRNNRNFDKLTRIIYEYDPADNLYAYLHPAMVRTLRKEGFQWITQFSYDPIDMARFNTEYQTHFLNLAYTPQKALSMMIAAEVARTIPRGADYDVYPQDTIFDVFRVSYHQNLSEMNSKEKYLYSNNTSTPPIDPDELQQIAGWGNSPIVSYAGTGAYFLDRLNEETWRLEMMPDQLLTDDPFKKTSLNGEVGAILYREHPMCIRLASLGEAYTYKAINSDNHRKGKAVNGFINIYPGTYLLTKNPRSLPSNVDSTFVAPAETEKIFKIVHEPAKNIARGDSLTIHATLFGKSLPDSLVIFPREVSFWSNRNRLYKMHYIGGYQYEVTIPTQGSNNEIAYNIVAFTFDASLTFPQDEPGTPLSWDYRSSQYYKTTIVSCSTPIVLVEPGREPNSMEIGTIPGAQQAKLQYIHRAPVDHNVYRLDYLPSEGWPVGESPMVVLKCYVSDELRRHPYLAQKHSLVVSLGEFDELKELELSLITTQGITYSSRVEPKTMIEIPVAQLKQSPTLILPAPFPDFLSRKFESTTAIPFKTEEIEFVQITIKGEAQPIILEIKGIWLQ